LLLVQDLTGLLIINWKYFIVIEAISPVLILIKLLTIGEKSEKIRYSTKNEHTYLTFLNVLQLETRNILIYQDR